MRPFLAGLLFLVVLFAPHPAQAEWSRYNPILRIGGHNWKNILLVFWSHSNVRSGWAFDEIVRKLDAEIKDGTIAIEMLQVGDEDRDGLREGAVLLCVSKEKYGDFVSAYLDDLYRQQSYSHPAFTWSALTTGEKFGLPKNLTSCWTGSQGIERMNALTGVREAFRKNFGAASLPLFFLNGRVIEVSNVEDVKRNLLRQ